MLLKCSSQTSCLCNARGLLTQQVRTGVSWLPLPREGVGVNTDTRLASGRLFLRCFLLRGRPTPNGLF